MTINLFDKNINAGLFKIVLVFFFLSTFMLIFYCEYYPVVVYSPIWNKFLMKI